MGESREVVRMVLESALGADYVIEPFTPLGAQFR